MRVLCILLHWGLLALHCRKGGKLALVDWELLSRVKELRLRIGLLHRKLRLLFKRVVI